MLKRFVGLAAALTMVAAFSLNAATVTGKITSDSLSGAALTGAKVVIGPRFGGAAIDSAVTLANGLYSFANVPTGNYSVTASKTGYVTKAANTTTTGAIAIDTVNVFLMTVISGKIVGTVVSDSARGPALAGVQVILSTRTGIGGAGTPIDTFTTLADGKYSFATVADGNYAVAVSKTGYVAKTANTTVTGTATDSVPTIFLVPIAYGKVYGTVASDSSRGPALVGAKVVISTAGGIGGPGAPIDSMVTLADGKYSFLTLAAGNYSVTVSKTGYTAKSVNTAVVGTASDTVAVIFLVPIAYGKVIGTITADSANGPSVTGAKVVISTRGGVAAPIDSMVTLAGGKYSFLTIPAGNYSVTVSATGFTTRTVNTTVVGTATDTQNVAIVTIQHGSMFVAVRKVTDSSNVIGASITVTGGGATLSGSSGANGSASFASLTTGNYTVSVTIANYTAAPVNTTVAANRTDTVIVYMTVSANPTKVLKGIVTDSTGGAALANVQVTVRIAATAGGAAVTIVDSTDGTGAYLISGIPSATTTVAVAATKTAYINYAANAVALATAGDTTTYSFKMRMVPVSVLAGLSHGAVMTPSVSMQNGGLVVAGISKSAQLSIVSLNGNLLYRGEINSTTRAIVLPASAVAKGRMLIAIIKQNGVIYRNTVVVK